MAGGQVALAHLATFMSYVAIASLCLVMVATGTAALSGRQVRKARHGQRPDTASKGTLTSVRGPGQRSRIRDDVDLDIDLRSPGLAEPGLGWPTRDAPSQPSARRDRSG